MANNLAFVCSDYRWWFTH